MTWFYELTGFEEESPEIVKANILIEGEKLKSNANGETFHFGSLETPSLEELRNRIDLNLFSGSIKVMEVIGNTQYFHMNALNQGALFQAASQFNLLEMVGPDITPELGISRYERDLTQGPACAIACGAGTIYRNYFVPINGQHGQSKTHQIDCLKDIGQALKNENNELWKMQNGYALATGRGLKHISSIINRYTNEETEYLKGKLRVGVQSNTEVTISKNRHSVSQVYCSALPVAYSHHSGELWEDFARLILEATYEATLYAGIENMKRTGNNKVFLTLVGGGAFGNKAEWITDAISKAIIKFKNTPLDIKIVSYGASNPMVKELIKNLTTKKTPLL